MGLDPTKLTILSVGGSLGSRTLNNGWKENLQQIIEKDYQLIWQTGKTDFKDLTSTLEPHASIQIKEFISDMALAYSAADVIVSRAGAIAISELAMAKKASASGSISLRCRGSSNRECANPSRKKRGENGERFRNEREIPSNTIRNM